MRRVNITRDENIRDINDLSRHPNVRKLWILPWNFVLFEFYDPTYEQIDNPKSPLSRVTEWTEETRQYMNQLVKSERAILSPLYKGKPAHWQGNKLALFLKSTIYRILDRKNMDLPWFGQSPDWKPEQQSGSQAESVPQTLRNRLR